jgi:hypothetical protein
MRHTSERNLIHNKKQSTALPGPICRELANYSQNYKRIPSTLFAPNRTTNTAMQL